MKKKKKKIEGPRLTEVLKKDKSGNYIFDKSWKITTIPEHAEKMEEIDAEGKYIKPPEVEPKFRPIYQKRKPSKKTYNNGAIIMMADVELALGDGFTMEPDRNYKCRRWIVFKGKREWHIRYNNRLGEAIKEIKEVGANDWLKKYTMDGR